MPPPPPPPPPARNPTGIQHYTIPSFRFIGGTILNDVKVAYRSYNPSSTCGTVLIPTCFSGYINTTLTFFHAPNDVLSKYHVVVVAMLGNGESASPSNKPFFPEPGSLRYEDVIHAHYRLLTEHLNVTTLEAVVGFSMGGQQAYHWAVMYPSFVKRIVGICTSARTSPHNYAFLEGPITALSNSFDYVAWKQTKNKTTSGEQSPLSPSYSVSSSSNGSNATEAGGAGARPKTALAGFGRAYSAWLTSAAWFRERHWNTKLGFSSVESWINSQGEGKLSWDPDDLLVLARMWQMGDIGTTAKGQVTQLGWTVTSTPDDNGDSHTEGDQNLVSALKSIKCPVLLMPNRTDQYFTPEESEVEMRSLRHGRLAVIESSWGHTSGGGLCAEDTRFMNDTIKNFLEETEDTSASWSWL